MMNNVLTWKVIVLAALFSLGAKNENTRKIPEPARPHIKKLSSSVTAADLEKVQREAGPIMENILVAMKEKNYVHYSRDFNASMKSAYSSDVFKKNISLLEKKIGTYVSKTLAKMERVNQHFIQYYNAKFTKAKAPVVVRLVLERNDNKLQVVFLSFDAPELKDLKEK
jgi:hypothetical protein